MMMRTDTVSSMSHHDADPHDISVTAAVTESNSRMDSVDQTRSKGKARVLQRVMQRNELQRLQGDKKQKQLEKQRKVLEQQLEREEREVRAQLYRLQGEQRHLTPGDREQTGLVDDVAVVEDLFSELEIPGPDDVINPYPVTLSARKVEQPVIRVSGSRATRRRLSVELDDLDFDTQHLPPLQRCSSRSLAGSRPGSGVGLQRSESQKNSPKDKKCFWAGEPEAISSIRRPRRSVAQQRRGHMDHVFGRSQSLKEGTHASVRRKTTDASVSRSNSMKDNPRPSSSRSTAGGGCSRSHSLKEKSHHRKDNDGLITVDDLDLNHPEGSMCKSRHVPGSFSLSSSQETGMEIWTFDEDSVLVSTRVEESNSTPRKIISGQNCALLPPIMTDRGLAGPVQ